VLEYLGKYNEAEKLNRPALQGREKGIGAQNPDTLANVNNLAVVLVHQGKDIEAEKAGLASARWKQRRTRTKHDVD
jgi:hypothetical protein